MQKSDYSRDIRTASDASHTVTITIPPEDMDHFRTMCREQLACDHELMSDVHEGLEPETRLPDAIARVMLIWDLDRQIGGLYGSGSDFAQAYADSVPST